MAYRYTNTDKWVDNWFSGLKPLAKLMFMYLCDQCDIAGFLEINERKISFDTGLDKQGIAKAMKEIEGHIIYSTDRKFIFVRNFIKHQKNYPLNEQNKAHAGILRRLTDNLHLFDFKCVEEYFKAPSKPLPKGLPSPYGNGIVIERGGTGEETVPQQKSWRNDFTIYQNEAFKAMQRLKADQNFISEQARFYPGIDIGMSLEKSYYNFWGTIEGWEHKKKQKSNTINWTSTYKNTLSIKSNQVSVSVVHDQPTYQPKAIRL